jgi:putative N6-adenine-specific DNA methylase
MDPDLFLVAPPGLEPQLLEEAREIGLPGPRLVLGGVEAKGGWEGVRRANLRSRIASRVLARLGAFPARAYPALTAGLREVPWSDVLPADVPLRVEASAQRSRLAHGGALAGHVAAALERAGLTVSQDAPLRVLARLERDLCTLSLDTSGEPLHRRGFKQAVGRAPLRETLAAGFLRAAGWQGDVPVLDPMCGSGTIPIEAAERAAGLLPGRARHFAFELLPSHDAARWEALRSETLRPSEATAHGADRDAGAVAMARANAERAGVEDRCTFARGAVSSLARPGGPPGLVMCNPPYGGRIGRRGPLRALYGTLGAVLRERMAGWQVGIVTSEDELARATGLPLSPGPWVPHGAIRVRLWQGRP